MPQFACGIGAARPGAARLRARGLVTACAILLLLTACSASGEPKPVGSEDRAGGVTSAPATPAAPPTGRLAYATPTEVRIRNTVTDTDVSVAGLVPGTHVRDLIWAPDGRRLAWTAVDETTTLTKVFLLNTERPEPTVPPHDWLCPCSAIAFNGPTLFSDDTRNESSVPSLLIYPDDNRPRDAVVITGLASGVRGAPEIRPTAPPAFQFLGGSGHIDGVVVAYTEAPSSRGGPMDLYAVDPVGHARFLASAGYSSVPRSAVYSPTGDKLAYVGTDYVFGCESYDQASVVDLRTGSSTAPKLPSTAPWHIGQLWFEPDGTLGAAMNAVDPNDCRGSATAPMAEYRAPSAASWTPTQRPGRPTAYDAAGRKATSGLSLPAAGDRPGAAPLTVEANGRTSTVPDVTVFRWQP